MGMDTLSKNRSVSTQGHYLYKFSTDRVPDATSLVSRQSAQ